MRLLLLGLNYAPEPVGIGPYTAGLAEWLAARGHRVTVVCGQPYYPAWRVEADRRRLRYGRTCERGVEVIRCPLYVPARPTGSRRIVHHASFALAAAPVLAACARAEPPDLVLSVAPSLLSSPAARVAARIAGAPHWLHLQDFELEAALATGLLNRGGAAARIAGSCERWHLRADVVSSISPQMCARLRAKGVPAERVVEFRNWADLDRVAPLARPSAFRAGWGIDRPHVALYSGNVAHKQGIGIILDAARRLAHRRDLLFVLCGEGPNRDALARAAAGLDNVRLHDLQPAERLGELLGLASLHLLPQIAGAADLVLPSKLTNMLASGRAIVATAAPGTGIAAEVAGCGRTTPPGDADAFAAAIEQLIDDPAERAACGLAARRRAEERWDRQAILGGVEAQFAQCVARGPARRAAARLIPA